MSSSVTPTPAILPPNNAQGRTIVDCVRRYVDNLPFVGKSQPSLKLIPELINGEWKGVQCTHSSEKQSHHLTGTHIECSRHVIQESPSIQNIFQANSRYLKKMDGVHLKVTPEKQSIREISSSGTKQVIHFSGGETYALPLEMKVGDLEKIVTKEALIKAIGQYKVTPGSIILLQFDGCEEDVTDWPYLTTEATQYLFDLKTSILALNIPSIDRERDDGKTSNHKIFFQNPDNLIIESALFTKLPTGPVSVELSIDHSSMDIDCAVCTHLIVESIK